MTPSGGVEIRNPNGQSASKTKSYLICYACLMLAQTTSQECSKLAPSFFDLGS